MLSVNLAALKDFLCGGEWRWNGKGGMRAGQGRELFDHREMECPEILYLCQASCLVILLVSVGTDRVDEIDTGADTRVDLTRTGVN